MANKTISNQKRKPRFRRLNDTGIQIQKRDIEIIKLIYENRFLPSTHILALVEGSNQGILRRLNLLYHGGYIDRPPEQIKPYQKGSDPMIYGLGNKGADLLAEVMNIPRYKVDWTSKNREAKRRYIYHSLMISNFRTVLTLALKKHPEAKLTSWTQGLELKDYAKIEGKKVVIVPDAFFTLEEANSRMHFFLEADRSTMTTERFLKKMRAYWEWYKAKGHEDKYQIKAFRVLTICISETRKENLKKITKEADDHKKGSPMFWFALEEEFSVFEPATLLKPIWRTPQDNHSHFLLE